MSLFKKHSSASDVIRLFILPVVLGLAAGIAGALTAEAYLAVERYGAGELLQIGRVRPAVTAPLPEAGIAGRLAQLNVPLYARRASRSQDLADRARTDREAVGYAAALTSDGWLVTHQSAIAQGGVLIGADRRLLEPVAQVSDARTGLVFLKINAGALPVSGFEETDVLPVGAPLYASDAGAAFVRTAFATVAPLENRTSPLRDADRFNRAFLLDRPFAASSAGGAVVTAGGNLAGVLVPSAEGEAAFIPTHLFRPVLADLFRNQPVERPSLGVRYLDLDTLRFTGEAPAEKAGALVAGSRREGLAAVRAGSPAAAAGLLEGDVIVQFDGVEVGGLRELAELVAEYEPGAKIRVEAMRQGERRAFDLTLE